MISDPALAADKIAEAAPGFAPAYGLVLGTGFAIVADAIDPVAVIDYGDLPGFAETAVEGHAGRLLLGHLAGVPVACLQGRAHLYEGHSHNSVALPVRALRLAGCHTMILTNAAGSLVKTVGPGSLMMLTDHINMLGLNPLMGPNDERLGARFVEMTDAYDPGLRSTLSDAARAEGIELNEGVYIAVLGPNFETPAEIRAFQTMGADAVGMSTVPECLVARHMGMRVAAVSAITNMAAGMSGAPIFHEDALVSAKEAARRLGRLLEVVLPIDAARHR